MASKISADAARALAAAAAREAARKAAAEAVKKAAAEAVKKTAAKAVAKAVTKKPARGGDAFSTGQGKALRIKALATESRPVIEAKSAAKALGAAVAAAKPAEVDPKAEAERAAAAKAEQDKATIARAQQDIHNAANNPNAANGAGDAKRALEAVPQELRGQVLDGTRDDFYKIASNIQQLSKDDTRVAVQQLSQLTDLAGAIDAEKITEPFARAITDGKLEQPDGGFFDQNEHNSEREFVDGVRDGAGDLFKGALAKSLKDKGAEQWAAAVASGESSAVPDDTLAGNLTQLDDRVVNKLSGALESFANFQAEQLNRVLDSTLSISDNIKNLQPGDKLTLGASASGAVVVALGADLKIEVERTADGKYKVSGAGTFTGGVGIGKFGQAQGGAGAKLEFTFDSLEDAQRGALAIARQSTEGALGAVAEAVKGPDNQFLSDHVSAAEFQTTGFASADARFGLSGVQGAGAEGAVQVTNTTRVELGPNGKPTAVETSVDLKLTGAAENNQLLNKATEAIAGGNIEEFKAKFGFDPRDFTTGAVTGEIHLKGTIRTPLESPDGTSLADVVANPTKFQAGEPTVSAQFTGDFKKDSRGFHIEENFSGLGLNDGRQIFNNVTSGGGIDHALDGLSVKGNVKFNTFTDRGLDNTLDIVVASGTVQNFTRHPDEVHESEVQVSGQNGQLVVDVTAADGDKRRSGRVTVA